MEGASGSELTSISFLFFIHDFLWVLMFDDDLRFYFMTVLRPTFLNGEYLDVSLPKCAFLFFFALPSFHCLYIFSKALGSYGRFCAILVDARLSCKLVFG